MSRRLLSVAGGGAVAITLMACYGAPAHYKTGPTPAAQCEAGQTDMDADGVCTPADCDDNNRMINPAAADAEGDGVDQNCDGADGIAPADDAEGGADDSGEEGATDGATGGEGEPGATGGEGEPGAADDSGEEGATGTDEAFDEGKMGKPN